MTAYPGANVLYVLPIGRRHGEYRPAILVRPSGSDGNWSLHVFCEPEDGPDWPSGSFHVDGVPHSPRKRPGTWHWPIPG